MNRSIELKIRQIYNLVFSKIYSKDNIAQLAKGNRTSLSKAAAILENNSAYQKFAEKFAKELAKKGLARNRGIWRKYFEAARKSKYIALTKTWTQFEAEQLSKAVKNNFQMIKTIPNETLKIMEHKYTSTLIEEVAKGKLSRGTFKRQLESHGHKNAKVIARTETAKLQTSILEGRATDLGSKAYFWLASNDKRTRPSHKAMNGVVVFWRNGQEKPLLDKMWGNAGEFPNCRCTPQPIFDEDDLTKSNYKVYDYRNHKVINLTKNELLNAIINGSL